MGANDLGHAHPKVVRAISEIAKNGTSFGMPTTLETDLAKLSLSMVPGMQKIRFVNSGTEACMSAIRLARGYTNKDKIIKFSGCYHGHSDSFLIEAGSGVVTFGTPNSPGVTKGTAKDTLIAPYNDLNYVKTLFENNKNDSFKHFDKLSSLISGSGILANEENSSINLPISSTCLDIVSVKTLISSLSNSLF